MNKEERKAMIQAMVQQQKLGTQAEIKQGLEEQGVFVTQTTLSRDLRELGLIKIHQEGVSYYSLPPTDISNFTQSLAKYVTKVDRASFVLVLHAELGEAALMANIIDNAHSSSILGTLAGADTLLVICRDEIAAKQVEADIIAYLD